MEDLERIRDSISRCDDQIISALAERMKYIEDIIGYKKQHGMPILQSEQEKHQEAVLVSKLEGNPFK